MTYRPDRRTLADVVRELSQIATLTPFPTDPDISWADLLFADGGQSDVAEPSQALLYALARRHSGLVAHFNSLVPHARRHWLETMLGIERLPELPDRVVVVAEPEPGAPPTTIGQGIELRGPRTTAGTDRRYITDDTLTVLGAILLGVRGIRAETARDWLQDWTDPAEPFTPFAQGKPAPHHVDLFTDLIRFSGGEITVELDFKGLPSGSRGVLSAMNWSYSTPNGLRAVVGSPATSGTTVSLDLHDACGPMAIDGEERTFIRGALPDGAYPAGALQFQCSGVDVQVRRKGSAQELVPDAGMANDGLVDITKEFQPFGAVPKRGDSFYLLSDEAFGKPLEHLQVRFDMVDTGGNLLKLVAKYYTFHSEAAGYVAEYIPTLVTSEEPSLWWQRYQSGRWDTFHYGGSRLDLENQPSHAPVPADADGPSSEPTTVAGLHGHFIRLFLAGGDFGWDQYLRNVADFAAEAAKASGDPQAADLIPPSPPTVSRVVIEYRTRKRPVREIRATNGMARVPLSGTIMPFREPFARTASPTGVLAIGIDLPTERRGATVSLFVRADPGDSCAALGSSHEVTWEYWTESKTWKELPLVDDTSGLRQDGLIRFVAPRDWALGCPETSARTGRWLRARASAPDQVGAIVAVHLDAVTATRADPAGPDPQDRAPLGVDAVKGPKTRIIGVKKLTNPAPGMPGRPPEDDAAYLGRASRVARHRNRAVQAWDYEHLVLAEFTEVAAVRCLPHRGDTSALAPGFVTLVVVPGTPNVLRPQPSVTLAERIKAALEPRMPEHATLIVACPEYVEVTVEAEIKLAPGVAAAEAGLTLRAALDRDLLHPLTSAEAVPFGRPLFRSSVVSYLELRPEVNFVRNLNLRSDPAEPSQERIGVPEAIGLIASSGRHVLTLEEQL